MEAAALDVARQLARRAGPPASWRELALCAQTDPELFFPGKGQPVRPAKRVCAGCEVRAECLQEALDRGERFGIWGGLTARERRALARQPRRVRRCPEHGRELSGGPAVWHCPAGPHGHRVTAPGLLSGAGMRTTAA